MTKRKPLAISRIANDRRGCPIMSSGGSDGLRTETERDVTIDENVLKSRRPAEPKLSSRGRRAGCPENPSCRVEECSGVISHFCRVRLFGRPPSRSHQCQFPYARLPAWQRLADVSSWDSTYFVKCCRTRIFPNPSLCSSQPESIIVS